MKRKLYQHISSKLRAIENCVKSGNEEWENRHKDSMLELCNKYLPSGSGIDNGVSILHESKPNKLVFSFGYHHMSEYGMYDGWTEHKLIVTPSLSNGIELRITGPDHNGVKDYLYEVFEIALTQEVEE